ncbi:VOC family protein [Nocardia mexicana]|uniref:Catechol 2,3-dioxygenase-like lactoylglutathione lyase family enzyme n=1 Tax=Nocardia mexicana TaxID=279262 RepID=A0A370GRS3_9NOCA|nr:VOC family protein [Nocardia mexicana]RDI44643.1 catechol 2,3-dioxygenase-like lactoylglutathione lyase family enzyme [Nocardia mexicana]
MITRISHAVMYVADQAASVRFYVQQLGFELVRDDEMFPGARWVEVVPPGAQTSIVLSPAAAFGKQPGEGAYLHFACDDVHATRERLSAAGVEVSDVTVEPWGTYFTAADPDGNQVMIAEG